MRGGAYFARLGASADGVHFRNYTNQVELRFVNKGIAVNDEV